MPDKLNHAKVFRRFLPVIRHIPWKILHQLYDKTAALYNNPRNRYLIDGGTHVAFGAFPAEILEKTEYMDFGGKKYPVPAQYDKYLTFFYGKEYMSIPPIFKRLSGHGFARMDLGEYIYNADVKARKLNINGELFEEELNSEDEKCRS
ncbi:MAG: hypothetical protein MJ177_03135 [Clostridia bacterium]|nr:hypothetical protein [Clostridia bacterium]